MIPRISFDDSVDELQITSSKSVDSCDVYMYCT